MAKFVSLRKRDKDGERRCLVDGMERWYFGMSFAGSQYMNGFGGGLTGLSLPLLGDQLQFGRLCSSLSFSVTFDL